MTARLAIAIATLAAACTADDPGSPWIPVAMIDGPLAPEIGPPLAPRDEPSVLRVASWNLAFAEDTDGLAAAIANSREISRADIVLIQEVEAHPNEPGTRAARIASALGMTWVYAPGRVKDDGTHGIAIFSRYPIAAAEVRTLPHFTVKQVRRIALAATVDLGSRAVRIVDVHLDVRLGVADRIRELDPAVDDATLVIGGDFNAVPWSWIAGEVPLLGSEAIVGQETPAILDDYFANLGFDTALPPGEHTLTRLPVRCDDLYAHGAAIVGGGVEHVDGSDHWPIWIDVAL